MKPINLDGPQVEPGSSHVSGYVYVPPRKSFPARVRSLWHRGLLPLRRERNIWVAALRSLRGHIHLLHARGAGLGNPGGHAQYDAAGYLRLNTRAVACSAYIGMWRKSYSWIDFVDEETFLRGFDAGESWAHSTANIQFANIPGQSPTWFTPEDLLKIREEIIVEARKFDYSVHKAFSVPDSINYASTDTPNL